MRGRIQESLRTQPARGNIGGGITREGEGTSDCLLDKEVGGGLAWLWLWVVVAMGRAEVAPRYQCVCVYVYVCVYLSG